MQPRNTFPINIVLEEAYRYILNEKRRGSGEANKSLNGLL